MALENVQEKSQWRPETSSHQMGGRDLEHVAHQADRAVQENTGASLLHWLTMGSIAASIILFLTGRKQEGIFIGLWPPTFQALGAALRHNKHEQNRH